MFLSFLYVFETGKHFLNIYKSSIMRSAIKTTGKTKSSNCQLYTGSIPQGLKRKFWRLNSDWQDASLPGWVQNHASIVLRRMSLRSVTKVTQGGIKSFVKTEESYNSCNKILNTLLQGSKYFPRQLMHKEFKISARQIKSILFASHPLQRYQNSYSEVIFAPNSHLKNFHDKQGDKAAKTQADYREGKTKWRF